tara:strand:- start:106 stop:1260 length:1155 start_codon:yes stop_codon:yes gene_type:complete
MKRKICIVTGTRAEYGLLKWLMMQIKDDKDLVLQIIATGMHCSPEFGLTYKDIENDGFNVNQKIDMLLSSDEPKSISKSTGLGLISFSQSFNDLDPDIVIVLGDRFELLAASTAALFARIPIAHIHGGETTEGAFDEAIRHSITKMSWWHFVATDVYRKRVIQLGENPERVHLVGGLGVDGIKKTKLLSKDKLEKRLNFKFTEKVFLITFHPVTLENKTSEDQFLTLLQVFDSMNDIKLIFTKSNSDTHGRIINEMIDNYVSQNRNAISFKSMGQLNYLSSLQFVDAVVGNSSSGLLEAPSFKIGTINIGDRQKGRMSSESVINCDPNKNSLKKAFKLLDSSEFKKKLEKSHNPYDHGNSSDKIISILKKSSMPKEIKKSFHDI